MLFIIDDSATLTMNDIYVTSNCTHSQIVSWNVSQITR